MRKRLRKKKHLGEYQGFGVEITATLSRGIDFDAFLDDFIRDAIEEHGFAFGGGGRSAQFSGFVELGRRIVLQSNLEKVAAWLSADARVESFQLGAPVDVWTG